MFYQEIEADQLAGPNPYPTWTDDRGQRDPNPWTQQALEVNPQVRLARSKQRGSEVDLHRIEGATLDPGRVLTHPSRIVAPLLLDSNQPQTFDVPAYIISWVPNPIVQRSFGQFTVAPDDVRHTIPKEQLSYSYDALSQQDIADAAALAVRKAMYGR
jgi:hypothetical protein